MSTFTLRTLRHAGVWRVHYNSWWHSKKVSLTGTKRYSGISRPEDGIWQGPLASIRAPGGNSPFFGSKRHSIPRSSIFSACDWVWSSLLLRRLPRRLLETFQRQTWTWTLGFITSEVESEPILLVSEHRRAHCLGLFSATLNTTDRVRDHDAETMAGKPLRYSE